MKQIKKVLFFVEDLLRSFAGLLFMTSFVGLPQIAFGFIVAYLLERFEITESFSYKIVIIVSCVLIAFSFLWLVLVVRRDEKERKANSEIVDKSTHKYFGEIEITRKFWNCTMDLDGIGAGIEISSFEYDGEVVPNSKQVQTVEWIKRSFKDIRIEIEESANKYDSEIDFLPKPPRDYVFTSLMLCPYESNTFCLWFDIAGVDNPLGFSVDYENGDLVEFYDGH